MPPGTHPAAVAAIDLPFGELRVSESLPVCAVTPATGPKR